MVTVLEGGRVHFGFLAPGASRVQIVGGFTEWLAHPIEMAPDSGGWWRVSTRIPEGEYRFRYLVNGHWVTDYAAFGIALNPFGQFDSVLVVRPGVAVPGQPTAPCPAHSVAIPVGACPRRRFVRDLPWASVGREHKGNCDPQPLPKSFVRDLPCDRRPPLRASRLEHRTA